MNKKQFLTVLRNVQKTLFWKDFLSKSPALISLVTEQQNFKWLSETELSDAVNQLKNFDINQLWDKKFWGLKRHESISAVATDPYQSLLRIKAAY